MGERFSICCKCGAQRICKMGVLRILWAPHMLTSNQPMPLTLTSCFTSDCKQSEQKVLLFGLHQNSNAFSLRAMMLRISTRKKFSDKISRAKRWRLIAREIAPKAYKNLWNPLPPKTQTNGSEGLPSIIDDGSGFSGKGIALQTRFVISITQWCGEEDETIMGKLSCQKQRKNPRQKGQTG